MYFVIINYSAHGESISFYVIWGLVGASPSSFPQFGHHIQKNPMLSVSQVAPHSPNNRNIRVPVSAYHPPESPGVAAIWTSSHSFYAQGGHQQLNMYLASFGTAMALSSVSPLHVPKSPHHLPSLSKPLAVICRIEPLRNSSCRGEFIPSIIKLELELVLEISKLNLLNLAFEKREVNAESKKWQRVVSTALAAAVVTLSPVMPAVADLNKYEAETRGEFGIGSAAQFGSADLRFVFCTVKILLVVEYWME